MNRPLGHTSVANKTCLRAGLYSAAMSLSRVSAVLPLAGDASEDTHSEPPPPRVYECDLCARTFEGPPAGAGLLLWTRGEEVRCEEPPLCESCGAELLLGAMLRYAEDEEEE
jgi:hypothetical protein